MQVVSSSIYSDVVGGDFNHYFVGTGMVLKLPTNKRRFFYVQALDGSRIEGRYLTRDKEWKQRTIPFSTWQEHLDIIPTSALYFNTQNNAGSWFPSLSSNRKKSFPYNTMNVKFYAPVQAADTQEQEVVSSAFGELYGPILLPAGRDALLTSKPATVTQGEFILDKANMLCYYKKALIGKIARSQGKYSVELFHDKKFFTSFLIENGGFSPGSIEILPKQEAPFSIPLSEAPLAPAPGLGELGDRHNPFGGALATPLPTAPTHLAGGYILPNIPTEPYTRRNTPAPVNGMLRNDLFYDTTAPQRHEHHADFIGGDGLRASYPMHWAWRPEENSNAGWRIDAYTRLAGGVLPDVWVQPLWGRGWAYSFEGRIFTCRGARTRIIGQAWATWG